MVNITALQRISNFLGTSIRPMKKWSDRSRYEHNGSLLRYVKRMVGQIKNILVLISGDDVVEMLKGNIFKRITCNDLLI
jgi:hypothetical protein